MKLAILCGMPLSGKTTYGRMLQSQGWVRVSVDDLRLTMHGKVYMEEAEKDVWANAELMVRTLLLSGHQVIVDTTNRTRERRQRWIRVAEEFGLSLEIHHVDTDLETCLARNKALKRVPEAALRYIFMEYEQPSPEEGEIIKVNRL